MARNASTAKNATRPTKDKVRTKATAPAVKAIRGLAGDDSAADRVIHERMRLAITSALAVNHSLSFNELKQLLGATDGNLSVHARRLEDAGYIEVTKTFAGRTPRTEYRLAAKGRTALEKYLAHMEALVKAMKC